MPSPCTAGQTSQVCPVLCERPALGGHAIFRVEGSVKLIDPRRIGYESSAPWTPLDSLANRYSCPSEDVQL